MLERLKIIEQRYTEINEELLKPENISDVKKMTELSKEQSSIKEIYDAYQEYKQILSAIDEAKSLLDDEELGDMAKEELENLERQKEKIEAEIEILLLPKDPNDDKNVIMEIRGAAGGDEANIFAGDLFRMYSRYAENKGWKVEVMNEEPSDAGGFSQIEFMIKGENVYSKLKYESGAHRVQRVPATESQGRVHTSTATVLVMPEADEIDIEIKPTDIKVDVFRSGGAGGQHVNTTDSAVRITHIPTGIVVTCQSERSQIQNRERAMKLLRTKIYEETLRKHEEEEASERRSKIGTGDRSEKIRTYNYPQNRVTDHRIGLTLQKLDQIIDGELDEIIEALINEDQKRKMLGE
ncbi:MAG: peptide chain release factor 1 [Mollicutes bacterium]|jgi:peptide chain release factor 1|nr:peptide chain release factor 1 [Mollicutes bacterium]